MISEPALNSCPKEASPGVVPGGKARLKVLRKGRRQAAGNILDQARAAELRQHPGKGVANIDIDAGTSAALIRLDRVGDNSARRGVAARVAARTYDCATMGRFVASDLRNAAELGRDRANLDPHLAVDDAVLLAAIERRAGQTRRDIFDPTQEGPYLFDWVGDEEASPEFNLRLPIGIDADGPQRLAERRECWQWQPPKGSPHAFRRRAPIQAALKACGRLRGLPQRRAHDAQK